MNILDQLVGAINAASIDGPTEYIIKGWDVHEFPSEGGKAPDRAVRLFFEGTERFCVLNKARRNAVCDLFGTDADSWAGKTVTIQKGKTMYQGEMVDCVEIAGPPNAFD